MGRGALPRYTQNCPYPDEITMTQISNGYASGARGPTSRRVTFELVVAPSGALQTTGRLNGQLFAASTGRLRGRSESGD